MQGKPNPECYIRAAELIQTHVKNCLVFEDALSGIVAARLAGMMTVLVGSSRKGSMDSVAQIPHYGGVKCISNCNDMKINFY
jgi:beta-phosphoglucomutase-like phosphatase (HAD superfamily)